MTLYPEHEKLHKIKDKSQAIGEFMEWLESQGVHLARYNASGEYLWPAPLNIQNRLAEFFGIDRDKIEEEKLAMLDLQRKLNEEAT
jgi:hypothetical protein